MARKPDSTTACRYYGDLLTTPYKSAKGYIYPGHYYERDHEIDRVVVHHIGNGLANVTRQSLLNTFKSRGSSVTYAIFSDGEVVQYLPESKAPWTTSNAQIDKRSITIEVENCTDEPTWKISEKAYASLVGLVADIVDRYPCFDGALHYDGTKDGSNVHMHKWYANTDCPGPYIEGLLQSGKLVHDVNLLTNSLKIANEEDELTLIRGGRKVTEPGEYCIDGQWYHIGHDGRLAVSKDVYLPYVFQDERPGSTEGKWVRYGADGKMVKGWDKDDRGIYYFDQVTGAMVKGKLVINSINFYFDEKTGTLSNVSFREEKKP